MQSSKLVRRYAPLLAVAALQLVIVGVVPSKAPRTTGLVAGGDGLGVGPGPGGVVAGPGGTAAPTLDGHAPGGDGSGGLPGAGPAGGDRSGGVPGGASGGGPDGGGGGDRRHCVAGRQLDPAIEPSAPPCAARWQGGDNGGATYRGVTRDEILVIDYYGRGDPAVDTILRAQNAYASAEDRQAYGDAAADFVNGHYELYGRKVRVEVFRGSCNTIPPDYNCLRNEARQIASSKRPFAVVWNTSLASPFFAELSAQKVLNLGGWHFTSSFGRAWSPYHVDVQTDGTRLALNAASFYCAQVAGHPARYAQGSIKDRPRRLGLVSTNDPDNKRMAEEFKAALRRDCDLSPAAEYFYAQDISTAATQVSALVNKMQSSGVTTVTCFCDLVAPQVAMTYSAQFQYYPEYVLVGTGFMDTDAAAQAYDRRSFQYAFGLSSIGAQEPAERDVGARVWRASGRQGNPPWKAAGQLWEYYSLLASMLQAAGPHLTPATAYAGIQRYGSAPGGANLASRGLVGDWSWNDDMRVVYWSSTRVSAFNGRAGTYVDVTPGRRYGPGTYPRGEFVRGDG